MSIRDRSIASLCALTLVALTAGCQKEYPNCKAFAFTSDGGVPRLLDEDASPEDCGRIRVQESMVDEPAVLECALDLVADGKPMKLEVDVDPESEVGESWVIYSDEDGLAMRWRNVRNDLSGHLDARVLELDTGRIADCRDAEDAYERFSCLEEALVAAEVVKTCMSEDTQSI